jgi:hypothetical protein
MFLELWKCCSGNGSTVFLLLKEPVLCFHYIFRSEKENVLMLFSCVLCLSQLAILTSLLHDFIAINIQLTYLNTILYN